MKVLNRIKSISNYTVNQKMPIFSFNLQKAFKHVGRRGKEKEKEK